MATERKQTGDRTYAVSTTACSFCNQPIGDQVKFPTHLTRMCLPQLDEDAVRDALEDLGEASTADVEACVIGQTRPYEQAERRDVALDAVLDNVRRLHVVLEDDGESDGGPS